MKRGLGFVICAPPLEYDTPPLESEVKAAFLLNFTKFIDWPPAAFPSASAPMRFCILETGGVIRFVLENKHVRFDINQIAARSAGLETSSRLLKVARNVQSGGGD